MGTALKILFSGQSMGPDSTVSQADKKANIPFQLSRGEIVALFNSFGRLADGNDILFMRKDCFFLVFLKLLWCFLTFGKKYLFVYSNYVVKNMNNRGFSQQKIFLVM